MSLAFEVLIVLWKIWENISIALKENSRLRRNIAMEYTYLNNVKIFRRYFDSAFFLKKSHNEAQ